MKSNTEIILSPIGYIESPYREKFAIPRQPGLARSARGKIILESPYHSPEMVRGLEKFSHLWVIFNFHATQQQGWKPLVRPPRLGGNKKVGVLATRSTFRPNPIGMSVVKLDNIVTTKNTIEIHISALDLLHKTPVIDIKPYISYSDAVPNSEADYAELPPSNNITIHFSEKARLQLNLIEIQNPDYQKLTQLITEVLQQDPRPAYKKGKPDDKIYGMQLYNINIQWSFINTNNIEVIIIEELDCS